MASHYDDFLPDAQLQSQISCQVALCDHVAGIDWNDNRNNRYDGLVWLALARMVDIAQDVPEITRNPSELSVFKQYTVGCLVDLIRSGKDLSGEAGKL